LIGAHVTFASKAQIVPTARAGWTAWDAVPVAVTKFFTYEEINSWNCLEAGAADDRSGIGCSCARKGCSGNNCSRQGKTQR
jgi:hypothetical protein